MRHVLLIDDDATIRDLLSDYLAQHAFRVTALGDSLTGMYENLAAEIETVGKKP